jgi:hypothetical protein
MRYASFEEKNGEWIEKERFKYLECAKNEMNMGRKVLDMEELREITFEELYERL